MKIRKAQQPDWIDIALLVQEASAELKSRYGNPNATPIVSGLIAYGISRNEPVFVLVDNRDVLQGFCAWVHTDESEDGECVGAGTFVRPAFRKSEWSGKLRESVTRDAKSRGYEFVTGTIYGDNAGAKRSCEKLGFEQVGIVVRLDF